MDRVSLLLTASRFGAKYLLDIFSQMRPHDVVLDDLMHPSEVSIQAVAEFLGESEATILQLVTQGPADLWDRIVAASESSCRHCIAKIHHYHQPRKSEFWDSVAKSGRVIHLVRLNLFESYLSREIAQKSGRWQVKHGAGVASLTDLTVTLDPVEARKHIDARLRDIEWARAQFSNKADYYEIAFEDINRAPGSCAAVIRDIYGYLPGAMPHSGTIRSGLTRIKQRSNADIIENYADVAHLDRRWV